MRPPRPLAGLQASTSLPEGQPPTSTGEAGVSPPCLARPQQTPSELGGALGWAPRGAEVVAVVVGWG